MMVPDNPLRPRQEALQDMARLRDSLASGFLVAMPLTFSSSAGGRTASADSGLTGVANGIMNLSYRQFISAKSGGSLDNRLNLSCDGCTRTPAGLKQIFDAPRQQHDFGYRNFGNGARLGRNDSTRLWIGDRFHEEMNRVCADSHPRFVDQGNLTVCRYQAQVMYDKVRQFGSSAFYGRGAED